MNNLQILMMNQGKTKAINGYLYSGNAAFNMVLPDSWIVPVQASFDTLLTTTSDDSGSLKETGLVFWDTPNTGATNSTGYTAYGSGRRTTLFNNLKLTFNCWGSDGYYMNLHYSDLGIIIANDLDAKDGLSIRALYNGGGDPGSTFTDYNGNEYDVVQIGSQYWTVQNLKTTYLNSGTQLVKVTSQATWDAATGTDYYFCAYDNDESNV